jgi:hypothetical protein
MQHCTTQYPIKSPKTYVLWHVSREYQSCNLHSEITPDISRRRILGLKIKAPEEHDMSSYGVSSNATRCSEGSYTDTSEILPATEFNVRRATDTHRTHDRKTAQSRVIPNIDEIFTCVGASSGVKPPLGPSRLRRGVLTGSKSLSKPTHVLQYCDVIIVYIIFVYYTLKCSVLVRIECFICISELSLSVLIII